MSRSATVLVVESEDERRRFLVDTLCRAGLQASGVGTIAELERWPRGHIVVTQANRYTPWWTQVGASHVIVLADTASEGLDACRRGATTWAPGRCSGDALAALIRFAAKAG